MIGTLSRYLIRHTALRIGVTLFATIAFAMLFDLIDASGDVVQRSAQPLHDLLVYSGLRLPSLIRQLFPLSVLLGSLFAVADLLRHREIVVLWQSGLSPGAVALRVLPLALLLAMLGMINDEFGIPPTTRVLRDWGVGDFRQARFGQDRKYVWARSGHAIIRIDADSAQRKRLERVAVFLRNDDGSLVEEIEAARARLEKDGMRLEGVVRRPVGNRPPVRQDKLVLPLTIDLAAIALVARPAAELTLAELRRVVVADGYGMRATHPHRTWLQYRLAGPLAPALLMLLPFVLLRRFRRVGGITPLFLHGLAVGFFFQVMGGFILALGEGGFVAPATAAWLPLAVLALYLGGHLWRAARPFRTAVRTAATGP